MIKKYDKKEILSIVTHINKDNRTIQLPYIEVDFYNDILDLIYNDCKIYGNLNKCITIESEKNQDLDSILKEFLIKYRQRIIKQESM